MRAADGFNLALVFWGAGRTSRLQYWIILGGLWAMLFVIAFGIGLVQVFAPTGGLFAFVELALAWLVSWGMACNVFRRFHDLGISGWWGLLTIPATGLAGGIAGYLSGTVGDHSGDPRLWGQIGGGIIWLAFLIGMGCLRGQGGDNRFGSRHFGAGTSKASVFD